MWVGTLLSVSVQAQPVPLGVDAAVEAAVARPALSAAAAAESAEQRAEARREALWRNPSVGYDREQLLGAGTDFEESVAISQTFDFSGRRGLRSEAHHLRAAAARRRAAVRVIHVAAETRRRFYAVLHHQERLAVLASWAERLERSLDTARRREGAGDGSSYERLRLEREHRRARLDVLVGRAAHQAEWLRLAALTGIPGDAPRAVAGTLLPDVAPPTSVSAVPALEALALEARAARKDLEAADRGVVPTFTLRGGWKSVRTDDERRHGFVAGVSMEVPLFDHGQGEAALARARGAQAKARRDLLAAETAGSADALRVEVGRLRSLARSFRAEITVAAEQLARAVESGYAGGEIGLLELLDAHRGAAEDALHLLDLELAARNASIDLTVATAHGGP